MRLFDTDCQRKPDVKLKKLRSWYPNWEFKLNTYVDTE